MRQLTALAFLAIAAGPLAAAPRGPDVSGLKSSLIRAIARQRDETAVEAVKGLIRAGEPGADALLSVLRRLPRRAERYYWIILDGISAFRSPRAYSVIGDAVLRYRRTPLGQDLLLALQNARSRFVNRVVRRVLEAGTAEMKIAALDIASRIPVRRTVDILIDALEREVARPRGDLRYRIIHVLEALTGENFGTSIVNWRGWWGKNRSKGLRRIRSEARSTRTVVDHLDPIREKAFAGLEKRPKGFVLVITASPKEIAFDRIEGILDRMEIPHKTITKEAFGEPRFSLAGVRVIAINCMMWREFCRNPLHHPDNTRVAPRLRRCVGPGPHDMRGYAFSAEAVAKLKAFVERGGYLFTEDMVLEELLAKAWGKLVGVGDFLKGRTVEVRCAQGAGGHPYLRGVFTRTDRMDRDPFADERTPGEYDIPESEEDDERDDRRGAGRTSVVERPETQPEAALEIEPIRHRWRIDEDSPAIRIQDPRKVRVLLSGDAIGGAGSRAVALTFRPGGRSSGAVLHVLSHFGKQPSLSGEFALQNLLLNFILEAHDRYPAPAEK